MVKRSKRILLAVLTIAMTLLCGVFMVACGKKDAKKPPVAVDATTLTYDGKTFDWADSSNADSYSIKIVTPNGKENKYTAQTSTFSYPSGIKQESLEVTVYAKNANGETASDAKIFTRIDPIDAESFIFDEYGLLSWADSDDAESYILEINGKETVTCQLNEYDGLRFGQKNTVRVKPVNNTMAMYSDWSEKVSREYFSTPTDIKYDGEKITWKGYAKANEYLVTVNGTALDPVFGACEVIYDAEGEDVEITVQAVGKEGESISSEESEAKEFLCLPVITDYEVENGILTWEAIENADGYMVKQGTTQTFTQDTSWDKLVEGSTATNRISVKPVVKDENKEVYFSSWSEDWFITLLTRPTVRWQGDVDLSDGEARSVLFWDDVGGEVSGYKVKITDPSGYTEEEDAGLSYANGFEETGTYKISVQAIAKENTGAYSSKFCDEVTVIRLSAPELGKTQIAAANEYSVQAGFNISWNNVLQNNGYQLYLNNSPLTSYKTTKDDTTMTVTNLVEEDDMRGHEFSYGLQTLGSSTGFSSSRTVTLSSLKSEIMDFTITVLAAPTDVDIKGYNASWVSSGSASGFKVEGVDAPVSAQTYSFENMTSGTTMQFRVCALGNGSTVLPSNYTTPITVRRLEAPTDLHIDMSINNGQLSWDPVDHAISYDVWFNQEQEPVNTSNGYCDASSNITEEGVAVVVRANANRFEDEDKKDIYYVTSGKSKTKDFYRLDKIKFSNPAFVGSTLKWDKPTNYDGSYTISYVVYDQTNTSENYRANTNEFQLNNLVGGEQYGYSVKALGDGYTWLDSLVSDPCVFWKLKTPQVSSAGKYYVWNPVSGATGYTVKIEGEVVETDPEFYNGQYRYSPAFTSEGEFYVEVYANGGNGESGTAMDSDVWHKKQIVCQLDSPENLQISYSNPNCVVSNGQIKVQIDPVTNATGYRYVIGGAEENLVGNDQTTCSKKPTSVSGKFDVEAYAVGGAFNEAEEEKDRYYWISSSKTTGSIILYPTITENKIEISQDSVSWQYENPEGGMPKFEITLTFDGDKVVKLTKNAWGVSLDDIMTAAEEQGVVLSDLSGYSSNKILSMNLREVKIRVLGNGTTKISSDYTVKGH